MRVSRDRHGSWWLPDYPQQKIKGRFSWSREQGATLELQSAFPDPVMMELERIPVRPYFAEIILGELSSGQQYTLYQCLATSLGWRPRLQCTYLLEGAHFYSSSDIKASGAHFRMRHLEAWTDETPLEQNEEPQISLPQRLKLKPIESPFKPAHLLDTVISQPRNADLSITATYSPSFGWRRFTLEQVAHVVLTSKEEPFTLGELLTCIQDCSDLFTLLMSRDAGVFDIQFRLESIEQGVPARRVRMRYPGLKSPAISDVHPNEMLLSRSQLPNASAVISNWMNSAPKLRRAASWLTSSTRVKTHSDTEFLSYVQAAETAHRVLMPPGRYVNPEDYEKVQTALVSSIPAETQNDLKQKLETMFEYANEFSLRRRLRDLVKMLYPTQGKVLPESWQHRIERIVETRNYLIHNDPQSAARAVSGQQLFELTLGLKGLVTAVLLKSVGVPPGTVLHRLLVETGFGGPNG
jgi:hypothetical protein